MKIKMTKMIHNCCFTKRDINNQNKRSDVCACQVIFVYSSSPRAASLQRIPPHFNPGEGQRHDGGPQLR